jgi:outer membrane phospholipase A
MALACVALADDLDMVLAPPAPPVRGGDTIILNLYQHNNSDAAILHELPTSLPCQVDMGNRSVSLTAEQVNQTGDPRLEIPPRGFVKRQYAIALPIYASGAVQIRLDSLDANPLTLMVQPAPLVLSDAWAGEQVPLDEAPSMLQAFLADLSTYEPMYFLFGVDPGLEQSKFQLSFKYRLFNPEGLLARNAPWLSDFYLAYSQRSIWDLKNDSKPFDDTSYMPEMFFQLPKINLDIDRVSAFGIRTGFQHESNGEGGDASRSTNYLYIKPILGIHLVGRYHLKVAPKIFTYVANDNDTNADLDDYRGYFDLEVGIIDPKGLALKSYFWWAREGATVQADVSYPMTRMLGENLNLYLYAQYFSGYAETLGRFNERNHAFRLGFSIVR